MFFELRVSLELSFLAGDDACLEKAYIPAFDKCAYIFPGDPSFVRMHVCVCT